MKVLISMCDFPVNGGLNCSIGIPGCLRVEKCNRSVFFLFYSKFDVLVDGIEMVVEFCKVFSGEADVTVVNISIPPLRGVVSNALSLTCSITKFAKIALTGEPMGQPNICL